MRAAAILMVVAVHAPLTYPGEQITSMLGIDLFFAISGFLIAQMIAERFDGISGWPAYQAFMLNRWLRIFPLYYLILAAFLVYAALLYPPAWRGVGSFVPPWRFVFFLQDLTAGRPNDHDYASFFLVSWSLAIEELFYFACPLVALLAGRWRQPTMFWSCLGVAIIAVTIGARLWLYLHIDRGDLTQDLSYRRATLLRADVFVYGAAVYWLCRRGITNRIAMLMAGIGTGVIAWCAVRYIAEPDGFFSKIWLLSLVPMGSAMLIPAAMSLQAHQALVSPIRFLSTRTYALYLTHMLVPAVWSIFAPITLAAYLGSLLLSVLLANLLHVTAERPFMALRPRYAPQIALRPAAAE